MIKFNYLDMIAMDTIYETKFNLFEDVVIDIFKYYDYDVNSCKIVSGYDICANKNNQNYYIEVKFSRTPYISNQILLSAANNILKASMPLDNVKSSGIPILVAGAPIKENLRERIESLGIIVFDICNILFFVQDNEEIKSKLLSILDYSINDILPDKPKKNIFNKKKGITQKSQEKGNILIERIKKWDNILGSTEYENLCYDTLNYLFDDELSLWHRQQNSNSDLYRFDLICKIKEGQVSGLWTTVLQCLNSKYIIFEFKNYKKEITQKEIYTTDKYLYLKALRGVAIIVSCKGASSNAEKAIRGTFRENGKLILSINNDDLVKMVKMKMEKNIPADHLYSKFDDLLISLEK